jgi:hypothetical protein
LDEGKFVRDYCFKTFFLENQLIRSDFDLTPLSNQMKIDRDHCFLIIEPLRKEVIESTFLKWMKVELIFPLSYKQCVINEYEKSSIFNKLMAVSIASCMGMTDDEKEIEMKDFDRICRHVTRETNKNCDAASKQ